MYEFDYVPELDREICFDVDNKGRVCGVVTRDKTGRLVTPRQRDINWSEQYNEGLKLESKGSQN